MMNKLFVVIVSFCVVLCSCSSSAKHKYVLTKIQSSDGGVIEYWYDDLRKCVLESYVDADFKIVRPENRLIYDQVAGYTSTRRSGSMLELGAELFPEKSYLSYNDEGKVETEGWDFDGDSKVDKTFLYFYNESNELVKRECEEDNVSRVAGRFFQYNERNLLTFYVGHSLAGFEWKKNEYDERGLLQRSFFDLVLYGDFPDVNYIEDLLQVKPISSFVSRSHKEFVYDEEGYLVYQAYFAGGDKRDETKYIYDKDKLLISEQSSRGVKKYSYNSNGSLVLEEFVSLGAGFQNYVIAFIYDKYGFLEREIHTFSDGSEMIKNYCFDKRRNLIELQTSFSSHSEILYDRFSYERVVVEDLVQ